MDVVRTNISRLNGEIGVETEVGVGTRFTLKLPLTVVISDALMVRVGTEILAVPLPAVRSILALGTADVRRVGGGEMVEVDGEWLDLLRLDVILGLAPQAAGRKIPTLVLRAEGRSLAVAVGELLRKEEIVIKGLGEFLEGVGPFAGTAISGEGRLMLVLDPSRLRHGRESVQESSNGHERREAPLDAPTAAARGRGVVLLVDDSVSVRRFVGAMLTKAGFTVHTAVDGMDALEQLGELAVDVVITDLELPRMNGYELIEAMRRRPATRDLPVAILTTRVGAKHMHFARRLGVQHYVTKPIDETAFVRLVASLADHVPTVTVAPENGGA
jgi:chemosensory pili system protein ChpA (sensor histidine kinase/response regulator)